MSHAQREIGVQIGEVIAGKYRVEERIGIGGMGAVVAARHLELGARVAIKVLLPEVARERDAVARFSREARAMFNLKSEHAAKVLDIGRLPNGGPFMVMEYLTGCDLGRVIEVHGHLPPDEGVHLVLQACEAVAEAHSLGIVHRDIKPQNLFVSTRVDGSATLKVLDFGISKVPLDSGEHKSLTLSSAVMGTPLYMSPEQLYSSADCDGRSDIWAIGVVLYELLTGTLPFQAPSAPALYALLLASTPKPPNEIRPEIPGELSRVILNCLERDRQKRIGAVTDLVRLLAPFDSKDLDGTRFKWMPTTKKTEWKQSAELDSTQEAASLPTEITWEDSRPKKRNPALVAAGTFLIVFAIAGAVGWKLTHASATTPTEPIESAVATDPIVPSASSVASATSADPAATASAALATSTTAAAATTRKPPHFTHKTHPAPPNLLNNRTW